jgi:hypothetical protein
MRQAAVVAGIDTALADGGYDAEHNHRLGREESGVRRTMIRLNPRNTGERWPKTPHRRAMREQFDHALYHQRWHAESSFSQHKRRLGSALTTRHDEAQGRESARRVITRNLMPSPPWPACWASRCPATTHGAAARLQRMPLRTQRCCAGVPDAPCRLARHPRRAAGVRRATSRPSKTKPELWPRTTDP